MYLLIAFCNHAKDFNAFTHIDCVKFPYMYFYLGQCNNTKIPVFP